MNRFTRWFKQCWNHWLTQGIFTIYCIHAMFPTLKGLMIATFAIVLAIIILLLRDGIYWFKTKNNSKSGSLKS